MTLEPFVAAHRAPSDRAAASRFARGRAVGVAAASVIALLASACGGGEAPGKTGASADSVDTDAAAPSSQNCSPLQNITTGTGNSFSIQNCIGAQVTGLGSTYASPNTVTLTYTDQVNYYANDAGIHAWVQINTTTHYHDGRQPVPAQRQQTVDLALAGGSFSGSFTLSLGGFVSDSEEDLDSVNVAFYDDAGAWDSNDGANYSVKL